MASRPVGKVRAPLTVVLLSIVTLGIYGIYYEYAVFKEMKDYSGNGIGGGLAVLFAIILSGIPNIFLMPAEVGNLYAAEGQPKPVQGTTGFWILLPLLGGFIFLWKTQGALNRFWEAHGAA
ncbi:MAG: DUF4234 domain-containing protein [Acidimicrobiales bacterium]